MFWIWLGIAILLSLPLAVALILIALHIYLRWRFLDTLVRIFEEKPLFIIPRGNPIEDAEDVTLTSDDGLTLRGCYLKGHGARKGVILFGLEFGSSRWSCVPYCQGLLEAGFDVFTLEPRNQGESDSAPGYHPLQWVTDREVADMRMAVTYLKKRPDADPRGFGFFGISKGANAGLIVSAEEPAVRCVVTDGAFGTYSTMVPYMRKWISIYDSRYLVQGLLPSWYYGLVALAGVRRVERRDHVEFVSVERAVRRLNRPLLMIHGGGDTYIKTEMARAVFARAREPKEFWLVPKAKHNQSLHTAGDEYKARVLDFFRRHSEQPPVGG